MLCKSRGFTLLELMITVLIISILAAIAYPSYQSMIANGYRAAAQADLMGLAAAMEQHYAVNYSYKGAATSGADTGSPAFYAKWSPSAELASAKQYNLTIKTVSSDGESYELLATPVSSGIQASDGKIHYYSDGRKAWDADNNGVISSSEYCWSC